MAGWKTITKKWTEYISSDHINIQKLIGMKDIPRLAQNKLLKYQYLFKNQYENIKQLRKLLEWVVDNNNNIRPNHVIKGLIPHEAYTRKMSDEQTLRFKMKQAKQMSITENTRTLCGIC